MYKYLMTLLFAAVVLAAVPFQAAVSSPNPEASQETRNTAALAKLQSESDVVIIYAQGLCCPSCAIGVRKTVGKLAFVDTARLDKGINLDAKHQLVTVALQKGAKVNRAALSQAIDDAGYAPIHMYTLNTNKKLETETLSLLLVE